MLACYGWCVYLWNIWTGYYSNNKEDRKKKCHSVLRIIICRHIFFLNYHLLKQMLLTYVFGVFQ